VLRKFLLSARSHLLSEWNSCFLRIRKQARRHHDRGGGTALTLDSFFSNTEKVGKSEIFGRVILDIKYTGTIFKCRQGRGVSLPGEERLSETQPIPL
jgi:hypothetical protein